MAKIRGFKPDLWTDDDFVEVSPFARLLWLGMWNFACDNGHLQDKSKQIKMRILPTDDVNCAELIRELEHQGLIERADGWILIPNLTHHQKPHKRWWVTCEKAGCELPDGASYGYPKRESTVDQRLTNESTTVNNGCSTDDVDCEVDGDGDGDGELTTTGASTDVEPTKPKPKRATQRPDDFRPSQAHIDLASELGIDLRAEWQQFCDHHDAKGSTYKDWSAALRTWIRNAQKFRRGGVADKPSRVQQHLQLARDLAAQEQTIPEIGGVR